MKPDLGRLTDRELEVLRLIGRGLTNSEIALALHRSEQTVKSHRSAIAKKLGTRDRVRLALLARHAEADADRLPPDAHAEVDPAGNSTGPPSAAVSAHDGGTAHSASSESLAGLIRAVHASHGLSFYAELAEALAIATQCRRATVTRCIQRGSPRIELLGGVVNGRQLPRTERYCANPPCQSVVQAGFLHVPRALSLRFPGNHHPLVDGAESFLGVPVLDSSGMILGTVAVLDDDPLPDVALRTSVLLAFARLVAEEAERRDAIGRIKEEKSIAAFCTERWHIGVARVAPGLRCVAVNRHFSEPLGFAPEELLGDTWLNRVHPEDRDRFVMALRATTPDDDPVTIRARMERKDRGYSPVRLSLTRSAQWDGTAAGWVIFAQAPETAPG